MKIKIKHLPYLIWILTGITTFFIIFILADRLFPISTKINYAPIVVSAEGEILQAYLSADDKWRMYAHYQEISPDFIKIILFKEDKYFYYHFGVNPIAIFRAFIKNTWQGRKTSGASTITMQVARLLNPQPRTYLQKAIEVFRAIQLEWHYTKNDILTMYLNLLPYGSNIEGIKAASWLYFGKNPTQLSWAEIALLCVIPNRPTSLTLTRHSQQWLIARNTLLDALYHNQIISKEDWESAKSEPIELTRRSLPQHAPHLGRRLQQTLPNQAVIRTTLQIRQQDKVTSLTQKYLSSLSRYGIHNAGVLVIDNATRQAVAYVGSPRFDDDAHAGQVDAVRIVRSPGSTLKPFIYGLGFDKGLCTPKTTFTDVPTDFDGYSPENFDLKFHGKITVEKALAHSLNVVAVKMLDQIGVESLITLLETAHFRSIAKQRKRLGLSLALGGCGVTLEEMTALYASLACGGIYQPITYVQTDSPLVLQQEVRLLSAESSFMLTEILSQIERPDLPNNADASLDAPRIAWKTGTSYGRRDAWSIGYSQHYTVGVWLGNHDGKGVQELTGAGMATPLLFKIFRALENQASLPNAQPPHIKSRVVCAETGLPPAETCENLTSDWFIPLVSPSQSCHHQKTAFIDINEKYHFCSACLPIYGYRKKLYPNYPPELITYFDAEHIPYIRLPPHYPHCQHIFSEGKAPIITSPVAGREYILTTQQTEMVLACQTTNQTNFVYWYVNNQLIKKATPTERVFTVLPKGKVKISCTSDAGHTSHIQVIVK